MPRKSHRTETLDRERIVDYLEHNLRIGEELEREGGHDESSINNLGRDLNAGSHTYNFDWISDRNRILDVAIDHTVKGFGLELKRLGTPEDYWTSYRELSNIQEAMTRHGFRAGTSDSTHMHIITSQAVLVPYEVMLNVVQLWKYYAPAIELLGGTGGGGKGAGVMRPLSHWNNFKDTVYGSVPNLSNLLNHELTDIQARTLVEDIVNQQWVGKVFNKSHALNMVPFSRMTPSDSETDTETGELRAMSIAHIYRNMPGEPIVRNQERGSPDNRVVIKGKYADGDLRLYTHGLHIEFRGADASDSPAQLAALRELYRALVIRAAQIYANTGTVMRLDKGDKTIARQRRVGEVINVMEDARGTLAGPARIVSPEALAAAVAFAKETAESMLTELSPIMDPAALSVLESLAKKPMFERLRQNHSEANWKTITTELTEEALKATDRRRETVALVVLQLEKEKTAAETLVKLNELYHLQGGQGKLTLESMKSMGFTFRRTVGLWSNPYVDPEVMLCPTCRMVYTADARLEHSHTGTI